jgi:hypothetical protein
MRGTDDLTVQQLMNYLGDQISAIDTAFPKQHQDLGYAHMSNLETLLSYSVERRVTDIQNATKKHNELRELLWNIERECGKLHDKTKMDSFKSGNR